MKNINIINIKFVNNSFSLTKFSLNFLKYIFLNIFLENSLKFLLGLPRSLLGENLYNSLKSDKYIDLNFKSINNDLIGAHKIGNLLKFLRIFFLTFLF